MFDLFWGRGQLDETRVALNYSYRLLNCLGIRPPQRFRSLYLIYSAIFNFMLCTIIPFVFNIGWIVDFQILTGSQVLTAIQAGINIFAIPFKVSAVVFNLARLRRAEALMTELDACCNRPWEFAKIRRAAIMGNRFVTLVLFIHSFYTLSTFVTSVAMGSPPFQIYLPFLQWRESRTDFWLQVFIEFVLFTMLLLSQVYSDSYAVVYVYVIRTHLQILLERVRCLGVQPTKGPDTNYRQLLQCIIDHKLLLKLHETIRPVISITMFVQFLITAIMLGCTMINMFIFASTSVRVACGFYLMAINVQIYPCCYQATLLEKDSEDLNLAIFNCNWIHQDKRFRKMMLFFMHRSQTTIKLTALKLFPINLQTNLSIAKFSFSLYTLLKNMNFGKEV